MIPTENAHLYVAARSHAGMTGKNNEDQFSVTAYQLGENDDTPALFAMIADGIGGHRAGEVASEIAVETITQAVAESDGSQPTAIMQAAIIQASRAIGSIAKKESAKHGMGTTCICAWIIGERLYIASVGNSRLYLIRPEGLKQLNIDHTWVQEAIDAGALTPEQARSHPNANIIRRYLGSRQLIEPDLRLRLSEKETDEQALKNQGLKLRPGDRLLLSTDGLTDLVEDGEILDLARSNDLERSVKSLIDLANANGGKDNITVIALELPGAEQEWKKGTKRKRRRLSCAGLLVLGIALLVVAGFLAWYASRPGPGPVSPTPTIQETAATERVPAVTGEAGDAILPTALSGVLSPPASTSEP